MRLTKWMGIGVGGLCTIGLVASSISTLNSAPNAVKADRINRAVQAIPKGWSKDQIAAFLKKESIEAGYVSNKTGSNGYYMAIIRDTSRNFPISGDTQYFFYFDRKDRFIKATSREVFTGP